MSTHAELMKGIRNLDTLMKAQIVQGGNSSVNEFAGSDHTDQDIPTPAPNGTNYQPKQDIAHKSVDQMSVKELEAYLTYRKSGRPNLQAAILEIEQLEGVTKSLCGSCGGQGCATCGTAGVIFRYPNDTIGKAAVAIADKWCCGPNNNPDLNKGQNVNAGGAQGDADPTPTGATDVIPVKTDDSGIMVGKANGNDEEEGMVPDGGEEGAEMAYSKALAEGLQITMKGLQQVMAQQAEMKALIEANAGLTQTIGKSIYAGAQTPAQGSQPQAARAPRSAGSPGSGLNIQPLQKGVVPTGQDLGGGAGATQPEGEKRQYTREEWRSMTKSAGDMIYAGMIDPMTVVRMESDVRPDDDTLNKIEAFRRGELQVPQQQGWQQGWQQ